ncbi:MAG: FUSC family protein, partial [Sarcina sp.]
MKKKIIGNTIIFVTIIMFINIFTRLFGELNSVVGVTVITAALMLLQKDLTANPFQNLMFILGINIFTGIFAHLASMNLWIGIPLNFIALFIVAYTCSSAIKASIVVAFGLQYLFMLFTPVNGMDFLYRMLGLMFGAIFIMLLQFIANRNKLEKIFPKVFRSILEDIIYSLEKKEIRYNEINLKIQNLKKIVYESRKKSFYISNIGKRVVDTIYLLEKINIDLKENSEENDKHEDIIVYLKKLLYALEHQKVKDLSYNLENKSVLNRDVNELIYILQELGHDLKENKSKYSYEFKVSSKFSLIKILKTNFKISSLRVSYALRLAIIGVISIFIVQIFNFNEGKWMVFTIFSVIQPYTENSMIRVKERINGTIIGVIIVVIAFMIFKNTAMRSIIILGAGYLNTFVKQYQKLIILVTISAVASIALEQDKIFSLGVSRLFFVVIGALLAYIGSKYIFPYKIDDGNNEIKKSYDKLTKTLREEIENKTHEDEVKSLYLLTVYLEVKLKNINSASDFNKDLEKYIDSKRKEINKIYKTY